LQERERLTGSSLIELLREHLKVLSAEEKLSPKELGKLIDDLRRLKSLELGSVSPKEATEILSLFRQIEERAKELLRVSEESLNKKGKGLKACRSYLLNSRS